MTVIDLNSLLDLGHFNLKNIKEMADEYWTDSLFANNGFSPATRIQKMCQTISRKLQGSKVFMHGSVPMYGICSTNLSRKSPGYRSMFACDAIQTLSHGNPQQGFKVNFGRRIFVHHHSYAYLDRPSLITRLALFFAGQEATHITLGEDMAAKAISSLKNPPTNLTGTRGPSLQKKTLTAVR